MCRKCVKVFQIFARKLGMVCVLKITTFLLVSLPKSAVLSAKTVLYVQVLVIFILLKNSYMRNEFIFYLSVAPT